MAKEDLKKIMAEADRLAAQPLPSDEDIAEEYEGAMKRAAEGADLLSRRKKTVRKAKK